METIKGYVEHIVYRNEDNGYTVLSLDVDGDEETVVGSFPFLNDGEYISLEGDYVDHPVHGPQFQMRTYEIVAPDDIDSMERYLGSGAIKGVGPALAKRITKKFKMDTFRVIEEEPERLAEVKGISEKKARAIAVEFSEKQEMRQAMMFLSGYGINNNLAVKIYKEYGDHLYTIIQENPYKMTDDIAGVGFKIADEIAKKVGIGSNSDYRIISGIFYTLMRALNEGHVFLPKRILCRNAAHILGVTPEDIEEHLLEMMIDRRIVIEEDEETRVYAAPQYHMEVNTARMLLDLNIHYDVSVSEVETMIAMIEETEQITFAEKQKEAIHAVAQDSIVVLTGGPGTGKTTTINTIIKYFELEGLEIRLAAPTGRAARRLADSSGHPAVTVHRLLEYTPNGGGFNFGKNDGDPLDADAIIIDEASMLDITLTYHLLKAVQGGCRLIFVGDVDQLPSVGAGSVLKDIIRSQKMPVVRLENVFRQAEISPIVRNAHRINRGQMPEWEPSSDFTFVEIENEFDAAEYVANIYARLTQQSDWQSVQVLSPMHKNPCGVQNLNHLLQQRINPPELNKSEVNTPGNVLRAGDKVMQIRNNYEKEVFNGDIGRIVYINGRNVTVDYPERADGEYVTYTPNEIDELQLAYAMSVHKSQGSEYPTVILLMVPGHYIMLQRNLLYTAVTRARQKVILVGTKAAVQTAVDNDRTRKRYSLLAERLQEQGDIF